MEYEDYKQEWEDFFTTQMRFAFNSVSIDISRVSDEDAEDLAESLTEHLITNFAHKYSYGRFHLFMVVTDWANQFIRHDLFEKSKALIEKTRKDDKNGNP